MGICQTKIYIDDIELDEFENLKLMKLIIYKKRIKNKKESLYDIYNDELNKYT